MEGKDRIFDTVLRDEMRRLNAHLPKNRRTVKELLAEEIPTVGTVDGGQVIMRKSELEELARSLPDEARDRLKLPLVLLRRTEFGPGAYTLLGDTTEEYALSRIVKGFQGSFEDYKRARVEPNLFYKPQVSELMRHYHSLIVIGFGVSDVGA